jgi:hypothetical protein
MDDANKIIFFQVVLIDDIIEFKFLFSFLVCLVVFILFILYIFIFYHGCIVRTGIDNLF